MTSESTFDPSRTLVVVGPTGGGKTALAIELAQRFNGEIVCMDSMQLYAETRIGTARPSDEELAQAPHHLFGSLSLRDHMTSVAYRDCCLPILAGIQKRGNTPILVGGTGLYMKALFEGIENLPITPLALRERLEARLKRRGLPAVYALLKRLDPKGADHLHPNDTQRILRFLEVRLLSGRSMLDFWAEQDPSSAPMPIVIGLQIDRQHLLPRLLHRAETWLEGGWIQETQELLHMGLEEALLQTGPIGYREIISYLGGNMTREALTERIFIATRQYAKRQMTWFRKASYIQWFPFDENSGYNMNCVTDFIMKKWG